MIIPKIELGNLAIGACEWFRRVPSHIVFDIVVVALLAQFFWERVIPSFLRVRNVSPRPQWPMDSDAIVIYLITSADPEKLDSGLTIGSVLLT